MIILPNKKELDLYKKYNLNTFLLPLENYSIGFNCYFSVEEINEIASNNTVYVLMNKFLHRNIEEFRKIYNSFNETVKFIIEDIGLTDVISKDRIIMYENHIVSNYRSINFLKQIGYDNVVINNDLTIKEIEEILSKTDSNLYYFYVAKNMLMYSRRNLVSNFNKHFKLDKNNNKYDLKEKVSKQILEITEEEDGSVVRNHKIFCASKYLDKLNNINKIIDFTDIDETSEKMILEHINENCLCDLIDSDYYFLENDIKYKVGDLK